jgi:hypothetical protein
MIMVEDSRLNDAVCVCTGEVVIDVPELIWQHIAD